MNPIHIPCASGNNVFTDFLIRRHGDLIQILGHPEMTLTPQDALKASAEITAIASAINPQELDSAVMAVRQKILNRQGRIHRHSDVMDFIDAVQYAQNQAMDLAVALQRVLVAEKMRMDDGK